MITNAALLIRPLVGLAFLIAGLLLLRSPLSRPSGWLIAIGGVLFACAEAYGVFTLRPFFGADYDEDWHGQMEAIYAFGTLGLMVCAAGSLMLAWKSR